MLPLFESMRPKTWAEVIGQSKAIAVIDGIRRRSSTLAGRAYWLAGKSGTGKTTIARLIAAECAHPIAVDESNAGDWTIDDVRRLENELQVKPLVPDGAPIGRAYILNEAHLMRSAVLSRLLTTLEAIPDWAVIVFTTTADGAADFADNADGKPLLSRCLTIPWTTKGLADVFADHVLRIAEENGLGGKTVAEAKRLVNDNGANLRAVIQAVESGALMAG